MDDLPACLRLPQLAGWRLLDDLPQDVPLALAALSFETTGNGLDQVRHAVASVMFQRDGQAFRQDVVLLPGHFAVISDLEALRSAVASGDWRGARVTADGQARAATFFAAADRMTETVSREDAADLASMAFDLGGIAAHAALAHDFHERLMKGEQETEARRLGSRMTAERRRLERQDHACHAVALAADRLAEPPPPGRRWSVTVLAEEVAFNWKLEGRRPAVSTLATILKDAVEDGRINLGSELSAKANGSRSTL